MLTFVYGQAQVDGTVALLSLARLRQEYYGLPPRPDLFSARVRKEALHELGHTFGLHHCTDSRCAMALSIRIADIDAKRDKLCNGCAVRLTDRLADLRRAPGATED
jgi:archaemetzincin